MGKKHLKFLLIPEALEELKNTMMLQSKLKKQEEIKPLIAGFREFEIRKDAIKVHSLDLIDRPGLWIKSDGSGQFYYGVDLVEFFLDLLNSKPPETIAEIYSKIEWVNASVAKNPETGVTGLLIETEMEKFECVQCGHCCLDLSDAFQTSVPDSDVIRWESENRYDILECVDSFAGLNDIWISPKTGEPVNRCPWLRKLPKKDKYICRIHETKPEHCKNFPKSKRHALEYGCIGFLAE
jgi:Fe-S-cluster containining protein